MFVLSMTAHTSAILPARLKKKKTSFFQSHSLVHNRLYSPIALGGLEVPLCKERHREVASIQTHFGGHCAHSCLGYRSGSIPSLFCCLAHKKIRRRLSQDQELPLTRHPGVLALNGPGVREGRIRARMGGGRLRKRGQES